MSTSEYEVFAIKYAQVGRQAWGNFVDGDPHESSEMPLDYYVWAIVGDGRTIVVDTGFDAEMGQKRQRKIVHPVEDGLEALGIGHAEVRDVISHAFEPDDVARMVHRVFSGSVQFHDGTDEIAPGITVHKIGGHTKGLQCVRVATRRGHVVLASDATHFYAHIETGRAFRVLYNLGDLLEGYKTLRRLASSNAHVVPGHDPLVLARYPAASPDTEGWIARLDAEPSE
jgi:glyoxylase-like metal-dependent hydrolase (beta-lactamase superfamily II)